MKERSTRCPPKLRILSALLAFAMLLTLLPVTAFAEGKTETYDGVQYYQMNGVEVWWITGTYTGTATHLTLKNRINGQDVNLIDGAVFKNSTTLTKVTLPTNARFYEIGDEAFAGCTNLESPDFSKWLCRIGEKAFQNCTSLKSIVWNGQSWVTAEASAFAGCIGLESVTMSGTPVTLEDNAFAGCTSLKSVTLSGSSVKIGNNVFKGCTNLQEVTLPKEIDSFGKNVFEGCTSLTKIIYNGKSTDWANCPAKDKIPANVKVEFAVPLTEYGIRVCDTKANEANCSNVLGDGQVEFRPDSNSLKLSNVNWSYDDANGVIDSTLDTLTITGYGDDTIKNTVGPAIRTTGTLILDSSHIVLQGTPAAISAQTIRVDELDCWYRTSANEPYAEYTESVDIGNTKYLEIIHGQDNPNETGIALWINGKRMPKTEGGERYDVFKDGTALLEEYDYGAYSGMHCTLNLKNAKLESDDTAILTRVDELTISGTGTIKGGNNSIRTKNTGTVYGAGVSIDKANLTFTGGLDLEAGASITNSTVNINGWTDYGMKAGSILSIEGSDVTIASETGEYALRPQIVQMYGNSTLRLQGAKSIANGGDQRCIIYTKYWYRTEPNGEYTEGTDEIFYLNPSYTYYELTTIDPATKPDPNPNPNPNPNPDPNPNPMNYKVYWVVRPGDEPVNGGMQIPGAIFGSEEEARLFEGWFLEDGTRLEDSPYYMGPGVGYVGNLDRDVTFYGHWRTAESGEGSGDGADGFGTLLAGGAVIGAAGVVAYQVGTELILDQLLPAGVAVPHTRAELALLLWNTAGRPVPAALPAFADVADPELAQAAQWAIEQGFLKARADGSFKPDKGVAKWRVIRGYRAVTEP